MARGNGVGHGPGAIHFPGTIPRSL
jgi:hypothetical protein